MADVNPARSITAVRNPDGSKTRFSLNSGSLKVPLDDLARSARESGFQGLELWAHDLGENHSGSHVRAILERNNLKVSAFQVFRDYEGSAPLVREQRLGEAERLMADMLVIGADTLLMCANTAQDSAGDRTGIVEDLRVLAAMAGHRQLRIAFEPLAWSRWLNTYEEATACVVAADHPALGLAVDAFHWFWGRTPVEFAARLPLSKCFEVQLCDVAEPNGLTAIEVARHHRLFPGEGQWPVAELACTFRNLGYGGFFNLEVFNDGYRELPTEQFISRAVASINALF